MLEVLAGLWDIVGLAYLGLAICFSIFIISQKREPAVTTSWILSIFFLPYIGIVLYLFFGYRSYRRKRTRKPSPSLRIGRVYGDISAESAAAPPLEGGLENIENIAARLSSFPSCAGNKITLLEGTDQTDAMLADAIRAAKRHVHMEYYIFRPDERGELFRDLLIKKVSEGVPCRLIIDSLGSFGMQQDFLDPLIAAGGRVAFFRPLMIFRKPWEVHLRNHRKLTVVDGEIGFAGSQNIGHDPVHWRRRIMAWRESNVCLQGPVVDQLQAIFAEDWQFAAGEDLHGATYYPPKYERGPSRAQMVPTGPDSKENVLHLVLLTAIHAARRRISILTPYFIPTQAVCLALQCAARRGVQVDVVLPKVSDAPIVMLAARSWYRELVESGVRVFEHSREFLHAKVVAIDGQVALVGSANMDNRSFMINFESSLLVYDPQAARQFEAQVEAAAAASRLVSADSLRRQSLLRSFLEGAARMLAPLL